MRKIEKDSLSSDLETVTRLLEERTEDEDPVGWLQFNARRNQIETELAALENTPDTTGTVGLFFSGRPVVGSRGVFADFGGKALDQFQAIVSTQLAATEGPVGMRGPIPQRERAQLIVSNVSRGSFGFILEEANQEGQLLSTPTKAAIESVADLLYRLASPDEQAFAAATDSIDARVLGSLTSFVRLLDDGGATLRIVEDTRDFSLPRELVQLARARTESLRITESERQVIGVLYILPDAKRFELHAMDGEHYRGIIAPEAIGTLVDENGEAWPGAIGEVWTAELSVREVNAPNREPRFSYRLVRIAKSDSSPTKASTPPLPTA